MNVVVERTDPKDYPNQDVYAVIGHPVAHSKSPIIHENFAQQTGCAIHYGRIFSELDEFKNTVNTFFARGGKGLNITVPFKLQAFEMAEVKTSRAQLAQAVNVLWMHDGQLWGDNTDGVGLTRDLHRLLEKQGLTLMGAQVLILGAGGAAQGAIPLLQEAGVSNLVVANRTHSKAVELAQQFPGLNAKTLDELVTLNPIIKFDLIINATATGLGDSSPISIDVLKVITHPKTLAYDMVYGKETCFMRDAKSLGIHAVDGLGMLVEQAAEAFMIWRKPSCSLDVDLANAAVRASY
jgi:shikimate dehydrogenase